MSGLRKLFGDAGQPGEIRTCPPGYVLVIPPRELDSEDIAEIKRFLSDHAVRIVAISGRGGVGKSTLALRAPACSPAAATTPLASGTPTRAAQPLTRLARMRDD